VKTEMLSDRVEPDEPTQGDARRGSRRYPGRLVLLGLVLLAGCITRSEYAAAVKASREYYEATKDDLMSTYEALPEPIRTDRQAMVRQESVTIRAEEIRAGLVAPVTTKAGG
jgi:hypothetical protein